MLMKNKRETLVACHSDAIDKIRRTLYGPSRDIVPRIKDVVRI